MPRPRWMLHAEALLWRNLMSAGMTMHRLHPPPPPPPSSVVSIPSTLSKKPGMIGLYFYTPPNYASRQRGSRYPALINFHGGGFTLGHATDDARWAAAVVERVDAVVISVDYRLAPEHPFPTAVDDGADAILWVLEHAAELGVDKERVGVSGFSAGGNMAFTTVLRYNSALSGRPSPGKVNVIVAWYPSTDFTSPRELRRGTNTRPDKELPRLFTELFDASYLWPPGGVQMNDPLLSPGVAGDEVLKGLPRDVWVFTCEWDELLAEGERFRARLGEVGIKVGGRMIKGVSHAWDKGPWGWRVEGECVGGVYGEACEGLNRVFYP